jgi:hypothetical protein
MTETLARELVFDDVPAGGFGGPVVAESASVGG